MITNGYPKCIQFNVETKVIDGKFLNIKIFNVPGENTPTTTVLRKPNSKFDIIPFNSNVSLKYKKKWQGWDTLELLEHTHVRY